MSAKVTQAVEVLERAGVPYRTHEYEHDPAQTAYGEEVASALQIDPSCMFKTLVAEVDGRPVIALVPVSMQLQLKSLARAAGGKRASMAEPQTAERLTGYLVGGISPLGQKRRFPAFIDQTARAYPTVFVSGGRRGLEIELTPAALIQLTGATSANLTAAIA